MLILLVCFHMTVFDYSNHHHLTDAIHIHSYDTRVDQETMIEKERERERRMVMCFCKRLPFYQSATIFAKCRSFSFFCVYAQKPTLSHMQMYADSLNQEPLQ